MPKLNSPPLGDMPLETFIKDYWQKKPLYIPNAIADVSSPIEADELAGLACEDEVESRLIIQNGNEWLLEHGPFNEEKFSKLPKECWTLLVQAVDHWVPQAADMLENFNFIPRWRIDDLMMSYAVNGGGVGPHFDNYDVFLVQIQGERKWQVGGKCNEDSPQQEHLPVMILSEFEAHETYICKPGDILYVPPGYSHNGIAVGDGCMTCSIGFRAPSHSDILCEYTDYIGEQLSEALRYQDPDLVLQENTGELSEQALAKVQNILSQYVNDKAAISEWFGQYITRPKYPRDSEQEANELTQEELKRYLEQDGVLRRNESSRFAYQIKDNETLLFVDGEYIKTEAQNSNLAEILCSQRILQKQDFELSKNNIALLLILLKNDALYFLDD